MADAPHLFIPKKPKKGWNRWDILKSFEDQGWKSGRAKGAYIAGDLSELQKTILLCGMCKHGFDRKKHHYYNVSHYDKLNATGKCDVCKEFSNKLTFYLHETKLGHSWTPRSELAAKRRRATLVG